MDRRRVGPDYPPADTSHRSVSPNLLEVDAEPAKVRPKCRYPWPKRPPIVEDGLLVLPSRIKVRGERTTSHRNQSLIQRIQRLRAAMRAKLLSICRELDGIRS
jgi:hypothetical protein